MHQLSMLPTCSKLHGHRVQKVIIPPFNKVFSVRPEFKPLDSIHATWDKLLVNYHFNNTVARGSVPTYKSPQCLAEYWKKNCHRYTCKDVKFLFRWHSN